MLIEFDAFYWVIALLGWVVLRVVRRRRQAAHRATSFRSEVVLLLLFVYAVQLVSLTLFPVALHLPDQTHFSDDVNLVLLRTIKHYVVNIGLTWTTLVNVGGNVLAFVPLGILLPLANRRFRGFWSVLAAGLLVSGAIEVLQWTGLPYQRWFDVDDLLLNTVGAALGFVITAACVLPLIRPSAATRTPRRA